MSVAILQAGEPEVHHHRSVVLLLMGPLVAVLQTSALYFVLGFAILHARSLPRADRAEALLLPWGVFIAITIVVQFAVPWIVLIGARVSRAKRIYFMCWLTVVFVMWGFDVFGLWRMKTNVGQEFWLAWTAFTGC